MKKPCPNGWDKFEEDFSGPVRKAQFYNEMARKAAFEKELRFVDKQISKAALQGFFTVKVGIITLDMTDYLKSLGFVINEDGVDTMLLF